MGIKNILTFDVEDWFHGFEIPMAKWPHYENRLTVGLNRILELLGETHATFFVLGKLAEEYPEIVQLLSHHEIGTHGWSHTPVYRQTPARFRRELCHSIEVLRELSGKAILGHRAAFFSITQASLWALEILEEAGIRYDSSIFPVKNYRYGIPQAHRFPHQIGALWEFPPSTLVLGRVNVPFSGGFYARFWPYPLLKHAIQHLNKQGQPAIVYFHPWEFDRHHPRIRHESHWLAKTTHYHGLHRSESVLKALLHDFEWQPMRSSPLFGC